MQSWSSETGWNRPREQPMFLQCWVGGKEVSPPPALNVAVSLDARQNTYVFLKWVRKPLKDREKNLPTDLWSHHMGPSGSFVHLWV